MDCRASRSALAIGLLARWSIFCTNLGIKDKWETSRLHFHKVVRVAVAYVENYGRWSLGHGYLGTNFSIVRLGIVIETVLPSTVSRHSLRIIRECEIAGGTLTPTVIVKI